VRRSFLAHQLLGLPHAFEQRYFALFIAIDTNAEVDLVRIEVGVERFGDAEYGVARRQVDGCKEGSRERSVHRLESCGRATRFYHAAHSVLAAMMLP